MNAQVWPMPPRLPVLTREQRLREVFARGAIDLALMTRIASRTPA